MYLFRTCTGCLLLFLGLSVGCKPSEKMATDESPAKQALNPGVETGGSHSRSGVPSGAMVSNNNSNAPTLPTEVIANREEAQQKALDPLQDGWDTEALHELTNQQLKQIGAWLSTGGSDENSLSTVIAGSFRGGLLRPLDLSEQKVGTTLTVKRADGQSLEVANKIGNGSDADAGISGIAAFESASQSLRDVMGGRMRVAFKEFRIEATSTGAKSTTYFQAVGAKGKGRLQVDSTWECEWEYSGDNRPPHLSKLALAKYAEVEFSGGNELGASGFIDCTESILGQNTCYENQVAKGANHWLQRLLRQSVNFYQGLAVGDVNGDGLDDVYVCQAEQLPNLLLLQNDDGTVTERGSESGVDWLDMTHSALFVDFDNDGDQDLALATFSALLIMSNDGSGKFRLELEVPAANSSMSLAAADFDEDGLTDLYVCQYYTPGAKVGQVIANPMPMHDAKNGGENLLLKNLGDWKFKNVVSDVGLDENNTRFSFSAVWEDYDNDGDLDLYVANDYGRNNLYRNNDGQFTDEAADAGVEDTSFGMSSAWGDYNHDGWMDLYVANMFSSAGNRVTYQRKFRSGQGEQIRQQLQYVARGNSLFRNTTDGGFDDVSSDADVMMGRWSWCSRFVDLNNDSWEDLLVMNGYITGHDSQDL